MKVVNVVNFVRRIEIVSDRLIWYTGSEKAGIKPDGNGFALEYKGHSYRLNTEGAEISCEDSRFLLNAPQGRVVLYPETCS